MQPPTHPVPPPPLCAVCDALLDGTARSLRVGARIVEVCCEACAQVIANPHAIANADED